MTTKNGTMWKILLPIAGALLTVGGLCATIKQNRDDIIKVEAVAHQNEGDVRDLKKDVTYIREGIDEIKKEVKK